MYHGIILKLREIIMAEVIEFTDHYMDVPHRRIYTFKEMGIPGLSVLGWYHSHIVRNPMPNHYHRDNIEIRLLIKGNGIIFVGGKEYHLRGGDIFIIPANVPHNSGTYPIGNGEFYWAQFFIGKPSFLFLQRDWAAELRQLLQTATTIKNYLTSFSKSNINSYG